jgi:hypothetical protein
VADTTHRRKLTPPEIARRYGIHPLKVLGWIRSGELRAVNVAASPLKRPRWRVDERDLEVFEQRRTAQAVAPGRRKRRRAADVIEFF